MICLFSYLKVQFLALSAVVKAANAVYQSSKDEEDKAEAAELIKKIYDFEPSLCGTNPFDEEEEDETIKRLKTLSLKDSNLIANSLLDYLEDDEEDPVSNNVSLANLVEDLAVDAESAIPRIKAYLQDNNGQGYEIVLPHLIDLTHSDTIAAAVEDVIQTIGVMKTSSELLDLVLELPSTHLTIEFLYRVVAASNPSVLRKYMHKITDTLLPISVDVDPCMRKAAVKVIVEMMCSLGSLYDSALLKFKDITRRLAEYYFDKRTCTN